MYLRITSSYNFDLFVKKIIEEDWESVSKEIRKIQDYRKKHNYKLQHRMKMTQELYSAEEKDDEKKTVK